MKQRVVASMFLAAVGNSMGYKNGEWAPDNCGTSIHKQMMELTENKGISKLQMQLPYFRLGDDSILHVACASALATHSCLHNVRSLCRTISTNFIKCLPFISVRSPNKRTLQKIEYLQEHGIENCEKDMTTTTTTTSTYVNYDDENHINNDVAPRSACIGLILHRPCDIDSLVQIAIESACITHNNAFDYLNAVVAAYFTSLAIQDIPVQHWPSYAIELLKTKCKEYILQTNRGNVEANLLDLTFVILQWETYKTYKKCKVYEAMPTTTTTPYLSSIPQSFVSQDQDIDIPQSIHDMRDAEYKNMNNDTIIAYDAFLQSNGDWIELCSLGMLHGGHNDTTGSLCGSWYGALYGFTNIPTCHGQYLEWKQVIGDVGKHIYQRFYKLIDYEPGS